MQLVSVLLLALAYIASVAGQDACPGNSTVNGYTTIAAINTAIAADLTAIQGGSNPTPPYVFTLCPGTVFTMDQQPLTATLSGSEFTCGATGAATDSCVISGGLNQVVIEDPGLTGYTLQNVIFKGITFNGSIGSSVIANGSSVTTAIFIDCSWSDFSGGAIQLNSTSKKALSVVITGGNVLNGTGPAIFSNDNGSLEIDGLNITGFDGSDGIITLNGGATTIHNTDISGLGASLFNVLSAQGTETTLYVNASTIHDITLPSNLWDAISYSHGASGVVEGSQVSQNLNVEFAINIMDGSTATVTHTTFSNNTGSPQAYTSIFNCLNNSALYSIDNTVIDNSEFLFYGFTGFSSFTEYVNTTFQGGTVRLAVFIDRDSKLGINNIVFNDVTSQSCQPPDQREFIEYPDSFCYYRSIPNTTCSGICGVINNINFTFPTASPTSADNNDNNNNATPTSAPSSIVIQSAAPTTFAPTTSTPVIRPTTTTSPTASTSVFPTLDNASLVPTASTPVVMVRPTATTTTSSSTSSSSPKAKIDKRKVVVAITTFTVHFVMYRIMI